jgi:hypothetical protein
MQDTSCMFLLFIITFVLSVMKIHTYIDVKKETKTINNTEEKFIKLNVSNKKSEIVISESTAYRLYRDLKKNLNLK